jgi:hypothetical protein
MTVRVFRLQMAQRADDVGLDGPWILALAERILPRAYDLWVQEIRVQYNGGCGWPF